MALLIFYTSITPIRSPSSSSSPTLSITTPSFSRLHVNPVAFPVRSLDGFCFSEFFIYAKRNSAAVRLISDSNPPSNYVGEPPMVSESDDDEDKLPINNLPLESKLLLKLEHKMKMKLPKKVRLRRKKLVRKRRMRKKGRWPPSKMSKLKNV